MTLNACKLLILATSGS